MLIEVRFMRPGDSGRRERIDVSETREWPSLAAALRWAAQTYDNSLEEDQRLMSGVRLRIKSGTPDSSSLNDSAALELQDA